MTLQDSLKQFVRRHANLATEQGTVGRRDPDTGELIVDVPGGDGLIYVTTGGKDGFGGVVTIVRHFAGATPGLPVALERSFGETRIKRAIDQKLKSYNPTNAAYAYNVSKHSHAVGSGNVDPVSANRFVPGLVRPFREGGVFGLKVFVEATQYEYQNTLTWFPGRDLDLTSFIPGTANKQAWIVVGIDPTTNLPTAKSDIDYSTVATMNPSQLDGFDFAGNVPLGAVVLQNGQTAINTFKDFADLRIFASSDSAQRAAVRTITANYTIITADNTIFVNASSDLTVTMPASVAGGDTFIIKRIDSNTGDTVTIDGDGNNVEGVATFDLASAESIQLRNDGSDWWVI